MSEYSGKGRRRTPAECCEKQHIRDEIDHLDQIILDLMVKRQGYVRRMAEIKQSPDEAFDADRIETMVARIKDQAEAKGLEGEQVELVWRALIDWNVEYERRTIAARLARKEIA